MKLKKKKTIADENSQLRWLINRNTNENISENQVDFLGSVVTLSNQDNECTALVDSDRSATELTRKGIFACPKYNDLFINKDDTRMK